VTESVSAAIEQQRAASDHFANSTSDSSVAFADFAGRMVELADMVDRSHAAAGHVAEVAATMQSVSQTLHGELPEMVRKGFRADLREYPRYEVALSRGLHLPIRRSM
jgi:methyl-accepting chemotaxis protein